MPPRIVNTGALYAIAMTISIFGVVLANYLLLLALENANFLIAL